MQRPFRGCFPATLCPGFFLGGGNSFEIKRDQHTKMEGNKNTPLGLRCLIETLRPDSASRSLHTHVCIHPHLFIRTTAQPAPAPPVPDPDR